MRTVEHTTSSRKERDWLGIGLGLFSVGLGIARLAAPRVVARLAGVREHGDVRGGMRKLGARELTSGIGILSGRRPAGWLWGRVAGDAMDLALLGRELGRRRASRNRLFMALAAVGGVAILDMLAAIRLAGERRTTALARPGGVSVTRAITVNRPRDEVYRFWRDFTNLPRFMSHLESVELLGERRSRWTARAIAGTCVTWEAEIVDDRPGELISWRSVDNADVPNAGAVRFVPAPGNRGTEIHIDVQYAPPAGKIGAAIAKLFGSEPGQQIAGDLRRFKQVLEVGEVVCSDASIHRGMHAAQPTKRATTPPPLAGARDKADLGRGMS
jgi:uncharacterized membrane protein